MVGIRSPNEQFAAACDRAFPGMNGWFTEFFKESREWMATPPWFRPWVEHEQSARVLKIWRQRSPVSGWRKSSYSSDNGGECVETASRDSLVMVCDTTDRDGAMLTFSVTAWEAFTSKLK